MRRQRVCGWQSAKGLVIACALMVAFVAAPWPREVAALVAAGVLLVSRLALMSPGP